MKLKPHKGAMLALSAMLAALSSPSLANGWYESRPWQFDTSADKANKAAVLDLIERKKGGYYDGFTTNVYNNTYTTIGTQINCNNVADATGNEAGNSQVANSPDVTNTSSIDSGATGNEASTSAGSGKTGETGVGNEQTNSGKVSSGVDDSNTSSSVGPINTGTSQQGLDNTQDNSGNQSASVNDSTACDMDGAKIEGEVESNVTGPLN